MSTSKFSQRFMDNQQLFDKYKSNIEWLHRNIPPDDIYDFAEQTYMAALYFLHVIQRDLNIHDQLQNPIFHKWATNIVTLLDLREQGIDTAIDLQMDVYDGE